jgi:phosphoribosylformylglycinamidine synthase subunit PurS
VDFPGPPVKAHVYVTYKPGVLDPQGQTVCQTLQDRGQSGVKDVRIGKYIEFDLTEMPKADAEALLSKISDELLANPVIESYRVEVP